MKFLMIHLISEKVVPPTDSTDEEDPAETRERDAWVAEMEASGIKRYGGHLRPTKEVASRHPTGRKGTFELRPFWQ
jgi:hypothetical protein